MKKIIIYSGISIFFLSASAFTYQKYLNWKIDSETADVKFKMQAHGSELIGNFKTAKGDIIFDEINLSKASIKCEIKVSDINTGNDMRDNHLLSKNWFNAKEFPLITFVSDSVYKNNSQFITTGKLTVKGIAKPATIPFSFTAITDGGLFTGQFKLSMNDFDVPKADDTDSDEITVLLNIPVKKSE